MEWNGRSGIRGERNCCEERQKIREGGGGGKRGS